MTYLKYSGICADMVRASLKEPHKAKAKARESVYFRAAQWKDGNPQKQGELCFNACTTYADRTCSACLGPCPLVIFIALSRTCVTASVRQSQARQLVLACLQLR